jgi:hypothetical protein
LSPATTDFGTFASTAARWKSPNPIAGHESTRTTGRYDRRSVALDEVEKVVY